jgi:AcrR family transcriptional regulator
MIFEMKRRKYTMRKRAELQEETRARIVDAAIDLHESVGPARTTISAIADRAGVERLTVYRHFPDEVALFGACSSTYMQRNPLPDVGEWENHSDPEDRTRAALRIVYRYYRSTRGMWASVFADKDRVPALAPVMAVVASELSARRDDLVAAWKPSPSKKHALVAVLGLAVQFTTWQSLDAEGLDDDAMAELVTLWCRSLRSSRKRLSVSRRTSEDRS